MNRSLVQQTSWGTQLVAQFHGDYYLILERRSESVEDDALAVEIAQIHITQASPVLTRSTHPQGGSEVDSFGEMGLEEVLLRWFYSPEVLR